jgi:hypothetical protein
MMPAFDGTGPYGAGPMTGWGRGFCSPRGSAYAPYQSWGPGYRGLAYGPGFGRGRGFRRGFGPGMGWGRGYGRGFGFPRGRPYV